MTKIAGYIVLLSEERQKIFNQNLNEEKFSEPVDEFNHSRNVPLLCFVINTANQITHISVGKRGNIAGTNLRRLNLTEIFPLKTNINIATIYKSSPNRLKKILKRKLKIGGLVPPKSFEALIQLLSELAPETSSLLNKYGASRRKRIAKIPSQSRKSLAIQKEAVVTAMAISGINREELLEWDVEEDEEATSFLDGLKQVRLREDPMVVNDLIKFPGHEILKQTPFNSVVFENDESKLTVILANRLPLEEQLGVDLIYYNETFSCFLMIQYKAMEKEGLDDLYRFPNAQLTEEINRMNQVLVELKKCQPNTQTDGYRLSENPFFLKFCPRIIFNPDNVGLVKGMYLPLEYWELLTEHPSLVGPRGGKRLSYRNVRRYFNNSEFITLASGGWVGSNIDQSAILELAIKSTLESGRAIIIAVNNDKDKSKHRTEI